MIKFFKTREVVIIFIVSFIGICGLIHYNYIPTCIDYGIFISISASLFGFLITTLSILLIFPEDGRIIILKEHESYKMLFDIFLFTIFLEILLFLISLIGNLYCISNYEFKIIFIWILLISILFIILCLWIIKRLIDTLFNKE